MVGELAQPVSFTFNTTNKNKANLTEKLHIKYLKFVVVNILCILCEIELFVDQLHGSKFHSIRQVLVFLEKILSSGKVTQNLQPGATVVVLQMCSVAKTCTVFQQR